MLPGETTDHLQGPTDSATRGILAGSGSWQPLFFDAAWRPDAARSQRQTAHSGDAGDKSAHVRVLLRGCPVASRRCSVKPQERIRVPAGAGLGEPVRGRGWGPSVPGPGGTSRVFSPFVNEPPGHLVRANLPCWALTSSAPLLPVSPTLPSAALQTSWAHLSAPQSGTHRCSANTSAKGVTAGEPLFLDTGLAPPERLEIWV